MYHQNHSAQRSESQRWGVFEEVGLAKSRQVDFADSQEKARVIAEMMGANDYNRYVVRRL